MKKLIKTIAVTALRRKNFKFLIKKSASKYLISFFKEFYYQNSVSASKKTKQTEQEKLLDVKYGFVLNLQSSILASEKPHLMQRKIKVCSFSGRAKGYIARVNLARTSFRKVIAQALLVGVRKSSF
jgi:ribosomal protein S14